MSALRTLFAYGLLSTTYAQCKWTVDDGNGGTVTLDLSPLSGKTIHASDTEDGGHDYAWSVCTNSQSCDGDTVMVAQRPASSSDDACYILGRWDASIEPTYDASAGTFAFKYDNGATDCGFPARTWAPTLKCQCGTAASFTGGVKELPGSCYYEVEIGSKYACNGGCPDEESGLSGGWVFVIILISGLLVYCVAGYLVMALTVNKAGGFGDVSGNIPQKSLWMALPSLVLAGCMVTKEAAMNLANKGKGGGGELDEHITTDEQDE